MYNSNKMFVTGGAGFIGSHLVDAFLAQKAVVNVLDNFSSGTKQNVKQHLNNSNFKLVKGDLLNEKDVSEAIENCDIVFHLAANPEVRLSSIDPKTHFQQNIVVTFNLLETARKTGNVEAFAFTSSSTVYGEPEQIPTPEDYAPLEPISVYGATKLACEAMITAYAHTYGFKAVIYRLANVIGSRSQHGVIYDFIKKLRNNPKQLEILGDGTQTKSYLYITDCIDALLLGLERARKPIEVFNVGSEDQVNVKTIAKIVVEEMKLKNVKFKVTGGVEGGRGWKGDVKNMLLDVSRLKSLGWKPKLTSEEAVRQATKDLVKEQNLR
ncbi:NAD-dependent epimerase/dehydratase family protein [Candidatus Bathyarchaeota archaeon A05DMB-5]|jgi:UDP-glucose 4-epimerase|nr:NAD-dependent epimerase/dehydratase family protein [Candidatus Bathyarchaeota archaeon A05DMB-5]